MKNLIFSILVCILASSFGNSTAHADIYLEPFAGYAMLKSDDDKGTGVVFGGRVGYEIMGFTTGVQYAAFSAKIKTADDTETKKDFDLPGSNLGVFAGFEFPILFRIWATYYPSAQAKLKNYPVDPDGAGGIAAVTGDVTYKGKGTEVGVGFTGIPFLDINLSVTNIKYDDITHPITNTQPTLVLEGLDTTLYMLSLSVPVSF